MSASNEAPLECLDPAYWATLAPDMHLEDPGFGRAATCLEAPSDLVGRLQNDLRVEGYSVVPPVAWYVDVQRVAAAIATLRRAGQLPPFVFVYDEPWLLYMQLNRLLAGLLGPGFLRLPDFWAWYVEPREGDGGWPPHRDKDRTALLADGSPKTLTVWLPLTDATPSNGCIYVVPANRDPAYGTSGNSAPRFSLQAIRALPAAAGSILLWNAVILHWGGAAHADASRAPPRISLALEFQRNDVPPFNHPLMRPEELPSFPSRLRLIAKQLLQYRHMNQVDRAGLEIARRIVAELGEV